MTKLKKITLILILGLVAVSLSFSLVLAQDTTGAKAKDRLTNVGLAAGFGADAKELPETIGGIIKTFLLILGIIFMTYMIYAGYLWMNARGEEEKVAKAKAIIRGSIIGLLIVLAAYAITAFVVDRFSLATGYNPPVEPSE